MKKYLPTYLKGFIMGAADVVPGVSGGTMALILGIYQKLLASLAAIKPQKPFQTIHWSFFLPLGFGILSAIFILSGPLHTALTAYTAPTYAFFFALIFVSGLVILRQITAFTPAVLATLLLGALLAYLFIGLDPLGGNHSLLAIFFSGAIAIMAMMLPGVSGSFLLLILGQYEFVLEAIHTRDLLVLLTLGLGCAFGLLTFARLLHWLLQRHYNTTLAFLIGMIFGSLRLPITTIQQTTTPWSTAIFFAILGMILVFTIERLARQKHPEPTPDPSTH